MRATKWRLATQKRITRLSPIPHSSINSVFFCSSKWLFGQLEIVTNSSSNHINPLRKESHIGQHGSGCNIPLKNLDCDNSFLL